MADEIYEFQAWDTFKRGDGRNEFQVRASSQREAFRKANEERLKYGRQHLYLKGQRPATPNDTPCTRCKCPRCDVT